MSKIKPLELNLEELNKYRSENQIRYAYCDVTKKELKLDFYGGIHVYKDKVLIGSYIQEYVAVEVFNNI
jgi:hypothetical protein